jgi:hypothetical protein
VAAVRWCSTYDLSRTAVDDHLKMVRSKASFGKMEQSWEYSEGLTTIEGKTADGRKFSASLEGMSEPIYSDIQ